ncbi:guanine nucleotide exchange factor for Rab-3A isoform X5 [Equus przewalskii]|uniref:RAB3A interacting protein like 1 n=2 Tax=Equus TaxID=9789 RepID=A0A3Q2HZ58_HORSE
MLRRLLLPAPAVAPSRPERPESPGARASSQRRPPGGRGRARVLGPPPRARDPLRAGSPRGCGPGRQREPHRRAAGRTDRLRAGRLARGGVGGGHGGHAGTSRRRRGGATPGRPRRRDVERELKLKDKECERLSKVREQLEQELEELTASLFEEAHKMVREANMKQAASEKQLKEARGKIDMLQAEVTALKTLVITSTPASPNRELHPQLLSPTKAGPRKGHLRHKSTSSTLCPTVCPTAGHTLPPDKEGKEVDTVLFAEFQAWRESPTLDKTCPFLERVYREDVGPCLDFTMQELSVLVRAAVEDNTLTIEPVASQTLPAMKVAAVECGSTNGFRAPIDTTCALSGLARACRHRIRLGDSEGHYYISPSSRARITAVCNFFTYIRYIQQGLVRQDAEPMFWEIMRLRKEMSLAKLGFFPQEA